LAIPYEIGEARSTGLQKYDQAAPIYQAPGADFPAGFPETIVGWPLPKGRGFAKLAKNYGLGIQDGGVGMIMRGTRLLLVLGMIMGLTLAAGLSAQAGGSHPLVNLETSMGTITLELYPDKAPASVANFLEYVKAGFYNGTIFHRVINGFMVQGGGLDAKMNKKATRAPIKNEADNGLTNDAYTVAMARTNDPDSATAQFFINVANNAFLNHTGKNPRGWGYAVFGKVVKGQDVVDKIKAVATTTRDSYENVPQEPVTIIKATVVQK
jgi:peptidyl-prolyl cis-trans isomerase B (cyclophilin B)